MPVKIPNKLPATSILQRENIFVMTEDRARRQDIRPLHIAILNLMPTKEVTETQLLRLLGNTPLQIEVTLLRMASHKSKNTSETHLQEFYTTYDEVQAQKFDGVIITGAPVELLPFEEVSYWAEMTRLMAWAKKNAYSTLYICWAAQAGLYYHYGVPKYSLVRKLSGVYPHRISGGSKLLHGFDDVFYAPHSRYTSTRRADVEKIDSLEILAESDEAGLYLIAARDGRQVFVTGHSEYDPETLANEYRRDIKKGLSIDMPVNYFTNNDPDAAPVVTWRSHANLLFQNWLNYCVYQETPYDITKI